MKFLHPLWTPERVAPHVLAGVTVGRADLLGVIGETIESGGRLLLVGPSGAGTSHLLALATGKARSSGPVLTRPEAAWSPLVSRVVEAMPQAPKTIIVDRKYPRVPLPWFADLTATADRLGVPVIAAAREAPPSASDLGWRIESVGHVADRDGIMAAYAEYRRRGHEADLDGMADLIGISTRAWVALATCSARGRTEQVHTVLDRLDLYHQGLMRALPELPRFLVHSLAVDGPETPLGLARRVELGLARRVDLGLARGVEHDQRSVSSALRHARPLVASTVNPDDARSRVYRVALPELRNHILRRHSVTIPGIEEQD